MGEIRVQSGWNVVRMRLHRGSYARATGGQSGCKVGAKWLQSGCKADAKRVQSGCKAGAKRGESGVKAVAKWGQSGVKADAKRVQNGCKAGAHSYNSSSAFGLQIGFRNWKLEYWDFFWGKT